MISKYNKYDDTINRIKDTIIERTIGALKTKIENTFGIKIVFTNETNAAAALKWVKKYDKNFIKHTTDSYSYGSRIIKGDPAINNTFVLKLDKRTYVLVSTQSMVNTKEIGRAKYGKAYINDDLVLYIFGKKTYTYLKELKDTIESDQTSSSIHYNIVGVPASENGRQAYWNVTGSALIPRPMDTIFLNDGVKDTIINHLNTWLDNEDIYTNRGLTYKTGILLYGSPGTGKSSMASAIANYLKCGLISIDTTTFHTLDISSVVETINADDNKYVVLIDEIDTLFRSREDTDCTDKEIEKTSKLLSLLDSNQSPTNVVFVATTNYINRLDKALIRKGRFDLIVELTDITESTAIKMCKSFNATDKQIHAILKHFENNHKDDGKSMLYNPAELQSVILETIVKKADVDKINV